MLRSSREVRRSSASPPPRKAAPEVPPPEKAAAEAALAEAPAAELAEVDGVGAVSQPVEAAESTEKEIYEQLVEAAEQVFEAAGEGGVPEEGKVLRAVRQALASLRGGDMLLAEVVRNPEVDHTWARRSANAAVLAMRLGTELGYDERRCLAVGLCALMHDLGMLKVPDEILGSNRLEPEQLRLLRLHPVGSQQQVEAFGPSFAWIGKIVVQVHERWDGSGYPRGLRGEQIHEIARLIGLADTYEAMAHPRADREARATYHALKEIIDLRNSHFDRRLIKALINIVSIFPLGSLVKLNNGEIGRVIGTSRMHPTRPVLEILVDSRGKRLEAPHQINLEDEPMLYIVDPAIAEEELHRKKR